MIVAELETHISRPYAPTRRVALGEIDLPSHPAPGSGGVLLAGIVATFAPLIHPDFLDEKLALIGELEAGRRIAQPRLRHRFQTDIVGLQRCDHRLRIDDGRVVFDIDAHTGTPEQHVLCALYAAGTVPLGDRRGVFGAIRRALRWSGDVDARFAAALTGRRNGAQVASLADPFGWARAVLELDDIAVDRRTVQASFRRLVAEAHPDMGGDPRDAAGRIEDLAEARRLLMAEPA